MSISASDGLILRGHLGYPHGKAGTRYPLAVLAHQYPSTRDSYAPLTTDLHALGVATLAFDLRGNGESIQSSAGMRLADTPTAPTMEAFASAFMGSFGKLGFVHISDDIVRVASWGMAQNFVDSSRVLLVGASVSGTGALLAAPQIGTGLAGVLTFGAAGAAAHGTDAAQRIRQVCESLNVPVLLASSESDPFDGANNARTWAKGLRYVKTEIVPGADHAMAIYYHVRDVVLRFVRSTMGVRATTRENKGPTKLRRGTKR